MLDEKTVVWRDLRAAVRSARLAPDFPRAHRTLRPRGISPLVRSRPPLTLLLWTASREGRLVWQDADGFALLDRPRHRPARGGPVLVRLARLADRRWEPLVLGGPPFLALALAVPVAGLAGLTAGLLCVLLALVHVVAVMGTAVPRLGWWLVRPFLGRESAAENAAANRPFDLWTMAFCHQAVSFRAEGFPRVALSRLHRGILLDFEESARREGVVPGRGARVEQPLFFLAHGATDPALRAALERAAETGDDTASGLITNGALPERPPPKVLESGGFVVLYAVGAALVVLVLAVMVPGWERPECVPDCAGRPADFPSALRWLAQRLLFTDPPGLTPATGRAAVFGWLVSLVALTFVPVAGLCFQQFKAADRRGRLAYKERNRMTGEKTRILIMVTTPEERLAVMDAVAAANGEEYRVWNLEDQVVYRLGALAGSDILLSRILTQGAQGPGGAMMTASRALHAVRPHYVILTGIGFGLKDDDQAPGDVMVATQIRDLNSHRIQEDGAYETGDRVTPSTLLLSRADAVQTRWYKKDRKVHAGPMLSASVLSKSDAHRAKLKREHPNAIGGEMEASGLYSAAAPLGIHWFMAKAIADWGDSRKNDDHHETAAANAAEFVVAMIQEGGLIEPPA